MKRGFAAFLTVILTVCAVPSAVFADDGAEITEITEIAEISDGDDFLSGDEQPVSGGISLENSFPDVYFRKIVKKTYDLDGNGYLSDAEIRNGDTYLMVTGENVASLSGIEYLTQLEGLECTYNNLTSLDLSKNLNLETLYCESNQLTSLSLGEGIRNLYCSDNFLTSLDVSKCSQLSELMCGDNPNLTELTLGQGSSLISLDCSRTGIGNLSLYGAVNLESLSCDDCALYSLSVSSCKNLRSLSCARNRLSSLDVTGLSNLGFLNCSENSFYSIKNVIGRNTGLNLGSSFIFYPQSSITSKKSLNDESCTITLSDVPCIYEAGHAPWEPAVTVTYGDTTLAEGTDYTLRYRGNTTAGRAGVWVTANEDSSVYIGSRIVYFDIRPPKPSKPSISMGSDGLILKGTLPDGASSCEPIRDNMKSGQYLDGYPQISGQKYSYYIQMDPGRTNGETYQYSICAIGLGDDSYDWVYSEESSPVSYVYLSTPSVKSVKNSSAKAMTVKWGKNTKGSGYKIQYATNKSFSGAKTVTVSSKNTASKKIAKLKKGKTYYVRVRAYKKSGGTTYYSKWSGKKSVKIKK